jgi:hypothetical protein
MQAMADVTKQGLYPNPLVTELVPLGSGADRFWAGEDYHQNYYADNPTQGYCRAVVAPKVAKFRWACFCVVTHLKCVRCWEQGTDRQIAGAPPAQDADLLQGSFCGKVS